MKYPIRKCPNTARLLFTMLLLVSHPLYSIVYSILKISYKSSILCISINVAFVNFPSLSWDCTSLQLFSRICLAMFQKTSLVCSICLSLASCSVISLNTGWCHNSAIQEFVSSCSVGVCFSCDFIIVYLLRILFINIKVLLIAQF